MKFRTYNIMNYYLFLYFFAGILQDFLVTLDWRYIANKKTGLAVLFSFLCTTVNLLVIYNILSHLDAQKSTLAIIIYAAGVATGTYFAMNFKLGFEEEKDDK